MHNNRAESNPTTRSLAAIVADMKSELKEFVDTRVAIFKTELREKVAHWKIAAPLAAVGVVLLGTSYLLITLALVALAAWLIGNTPYRWFLAFALVGVLWAVVGGLALYLAKRHFARHRLMPQKTIEVLKEDKVWLQREARNQL